MIWVEYFIVAAIFAVALGLVFRGGKSSAKECADCPLVDNCTKKNRKKSSQLLHKRK